MGQAGAFDSKKTHRAAVAAVQYASMLQMVECKSAEQRRFSNIRIWQLPIRSAAPTLSFRGIDNPAYYRLVQDDARYMVWMLGGNVVIMLFFVINARSGTFDCRWARL